ncbi:DDE-type integrase/transposase/recombinase, partial [Candidatus Kaiserbacteria bacterium]|nr:DDE-type integrase/transposase/recombinase [Candidatus Kaiserbacteria bacterium]
CMKSANPRVLRWSLELQAFDVKMVHIPGVLNVTSDAISRLHLVFTPVEDEGVTADSAEYIKDKVSPFHNSVVGHWQYKTTIDMIEKNKSTWPNYKRHVREYLQECPVCAKCRPFKAAPHEQSEISVGDLFEEWHLDTIGPLQKDGEGYSYIVQAQCAFSRFTELRAAHSTSAEEAARALLDVCARYGVPKRIRTDGGSQYANRLIRELTTLMGVQHTFSIAYVPQSNGLVEA